MRFVLANPNKDEIVEVVFPDVVHFLYGNGMTPDLEPLAISFEEGVWWHNGRHYTDLTIYGGD